MDRGRPGNRAPAPIVRPVGMEASVVARRLPERAPLAGGIVERERWGSAADGGDIRAIDEMVRVLRINPWSDTILNQYRYAAEKYVRERCDVIHIVAEELLRRREMSGSELDTLLSSLSQIEV
jgi:hypothetical protein